jgi:Metallo-peptidase family M12
MRRKRSPRGFFAFVIALAAAWPAAAATRVGFSAPTLLDTLGVVAPGEWLTVSDVPLRGVADGPPALELQRFEVFAPDARIVVHRATGDETLGRPGNRYFRGFVTGALGSLAYLSVQPDGEARGILAGDGRYWVIGNREGGRSLPTLVAREVPPHAFATEQAGFSCGAGDLHLDPGAALRGVGAPPAVGAPTSYDARVAIETDNEFLGLFAGDAGMATDYIGDLLGFSATVYSAEIDTALRVSFVSLWATPDPWQQTSTLCGLLEFGRYWNDNYGGSAGGDVYTVSHFMSGKNNGGGVAWLGVLCSGPFNYNHGGDCSLTPMTDNYGGPYGYSGDLDGNFDVGNPSVVWDIFVVSHEIGHNFDSPHSHCYAGLQGNPEDIDHCYGQESGCYSGATSLPSGCPGAGMGCGTLMSYCHLLGGGLANISLNFGTGHPYGVAPGREAAQMRDHVQAVANTSPACLSPVTTIFADGFESGDVSRWDAAIP